MTELEGITPLWIVANLENAIAFYRDVLGFEVTFVEPEEDPFFAIVRRGPVGIMLKVIGDDVPSNPNSERHVWAKWDAFVSTPDPEAFALECRERSPRLKWTVTDTEDGLRGVEITDADGYVLFFGSPA